MVPRGTHPSRRTCVAPAVHLRRVDGPPDRWLGRQDRCHLRQSFTGRPETLALDSVSSDPHAERPSAAGARRPTRQRERLVHCGSGSRSARFERTAAPERKSPRADCLPEALAPLIRLQRESSSSSGSRDASGSLDDQCVETHRTGRAGITAASASRRIVEVLSVPERIRQLLLPSVSPI